MLADPDVTHRRFVPRIIDLFDFEQIRPLYDTLLARPLYTANEAEAWLLDYSELSSVIDEVHRRLRIAKSCNTADTDSEQRYLRFIEQVAQKTEPLGTQAQRKFLASDAAKLLTGQRYQVLIRTWTSEIEIFSPANLPLQTRVDQLVSDYNKLTGGMTVTFDGAERTMRELEGYGERTDRSIRQAAFEAHRNRYLQDRDAIDVIFDELFTLRKQIAENAGLSNYRSYSWKLLNRFDYTPEQCLEFSESIAATCLPLIERLNDRRKAALGLPKLRPWDLEVDPQNHLPFRPFDTVDELVNKTGQIFDRISPDLAAQFASLRAGGNLDLQARKNKQTYGYQTWLPESKQPFIFTNASGRHRDVEVLLHESGHAFHGLAAAEHEPLMFFRAPIEFGEVPSLAMELFGSDHFDLLYAAPDAARARKRKLEQIISGFPMIAILDSFQHWLYQNPNHSRAERADEYRRIYERFGGNVDWSGYELARSYDWHLVLHLFYIPFYYIEYGIAQLGALQLWLQAKTDREKAISNYRAALKLGGTRPLTELFAAAGIRFDFSEQTLRPLMTAVWEELESLPE